MTKTTSHKLSPIHAYVFELAFDAMQGAEEIDGPEGQDYLNLMLSIQSEVTARVEEYHRLNPGLKR